MDDLTVNIAAHLIIHFDLPLPIRCFFETVFGLQVVKQFQSAAAFPLSTRSFRLTKKNLRLPQQRIADRLKQSGGFFQLDRSVWCRPGIIEKSPMIYRLTA